MSLTSIFIAIITIRGSPICTLSPAFTNTCNSGENWGKNHLWLYNSESAGSWLTQCTEGGRFCKTASYYLFLLVWVSEFSRQGIVLDRSPRGKAEPTERGSVPDDRMTRKPFTCQRRKTARDDVQSNLSGLQQFYFEKRSSS